MKTLDESMMKYLSFPDFDVKKMHLDSDKKLLTVVVNGGYLNVNGGHLLGDGVLFFNNWTSLTIKKFNSDTNTLVKLDDSSIQYLIDLCRVIFGPTTLLEGFGAVTRDWLEWEIINAKMHAEFNEEISEEFI